MNNPIGVLVERDVEWEECSPPADNPRGLPYPIRQGVWHSPFGDLRCYVLNDGQRIFDADDVHEFFRRMEAQ